MSLPILTYPISYIEITRKGGELMVIRRRRTDIGSVATRSPRPNLNRNTSTPYVEISSPSSSTSSISPSPEKVKQRSPMGEKKHKKRRESGLLLPPRQPQSPITPPTPNLPTDGLSEIPDWNEGSDLMASRTLVAGRGKEKERRRVTSGSMVKVKDIAAGLMSSMEPSSSTPSAEDTLEKAQSTLERINGSETASEAVVSSITPEEESRIGKYNQADRSMWLTSYSDYLGIVSIRCIL